LPDFSTRSTNGLLIIRAGSQTGYWNGVEFRLSFAPQLLNGEPYLDALDLQKTLHPLLAAGSSPVWLTNRVIVIDPGHGGSDVGTRSVRDGHYEKEFTLDWALRLAQLLEMNGWRVFLTRTNDVDMPISNRVSFAESHKPALFLSLHFNSAGPNQAECGLETYCLTPAGLPSNLTREFADDLSMTFPNNAFDEQNLQLALLVHRALLGVNGNRDRGVRRARFPGVLRGQRRPAVLIEGGYLSNQREAGLIAESSYRQRLAAALAQAFTQTGKPPVTKPLAFHHELSAASAPPQTTGPAPIDNGESDALTHNPELP
jgi:N-acetylmuramoyl-L-alanine amidase